MLTEKVSLTQLFTLILGFNLGSSLVFGIGLEAREDSWLVILFYFLHLSALLLPIYIII